MEETSWEETALLKSIEQNTMGTKNDVYTLNNNLIKVWGTLNDIRWSLIAIIVLLGIIVFKMW